MVKPDTDGVAWVMISLELPELVRVRDRVWLLPIGTLPKLRLEGFDVSCPEPANADEVSARIAEKMQNTRNPDEIPLHDETCFTMLPLNGALKLRDRGIRAAACRT